METQPWQLTLLFECYRLVYCSYGCGIMFAGSTSLNTKVTASTRVIFLYCLLFLFYSLSAHCAQLRRLIASPACGLLNRGSNTWGKYTNAYTNTPPLPPYISSRNFPPRKYWWGASAQHKGKNNNKAQKAKQVAVMGRYICRSTQDTTILLHYLLVHGPLSTTICSHWHHYQQPHHEMMQKKPFWIKPVHFKTKSFNANLGFPQHVHDGLWFRITFEKSMFSESTYTWSKTLNTTTTTITKIFHFWLNQQQLPAMRSHLSKDLHHKETDEAPRIRGEDDTHGKRCSKGIRNHHNPEPPRRSEALKSWYSISTVEQKQEHIFHVSDHFLEYKISCRNHNTSM